MEQTSSIEHLVGLCASVGDADQQKIAKTLENLARDEETRESLVHGGATKQLVRWCKEENNEEILFSTTSAIADICLTDLGREQVVEHGGIEEVHAICGRFPSEGVLLVRRPARFACSGKSV